MDIKELRKQLPHGAIQEIARRSNTSQSIVSKFFNGNLQQCRKDVKIINAAVEYLKEHKEQRRAAEEELQKVLSEEL